MKVGHLKNISIMLMNKRINPIIHDHFAIYLRFHVFSHIGCWLTIVIPSSYDVLTEGW